MKTNEGSSRKSINEALSERIDDCYYHIWSFLTSNEQNPVKFSIFILFVKKSVLYFNIIKLKAKGI